jgi:hypothetical protein
MSGIGGCGSTRKFDSAFRSVRRWAMSKKEGASATAEVWSFDTTWQLAHQRLAMTPPFCASPATAGGAASAAMTKRAAARVREAICFSLLASGAPSVDSALSAGGDESTTGRTGKRSAANGACGQNSQPVRVRESYCVILQQSMCSCCNTSEH